MIFKLKIHYISSSSSSSSNSSSSDDDDDDDDDVQDVFKESDRGLTRSPTTILDQSGYSNAGGGVQDSPDRGAAGHTDRSAGKPAPHDQSRHDQKKKEDQQRKKLEPSMKWRVLESTESTTSDRDLENGTIENKPADKQLRIKSSGRARSCKE